MDEILTTLISLVVLALFVGGAILAVRFLYQRRMRSISAMIKTHFAPASLQDVVISERRFPYHVRADLQRALDVLFAQGVVVRRFVGMESEFSMEGLSLSNCMASSNPVFTVVAVPVQYEEIDVGEEDRVRCLKNGLWLLERHGNKHVLLLTPARKFGQNSGMQVQVATLNTEDGTRTAAEIFRNLEEAVRQAVSYRGKILSLEQSEHSYTGDSAGIRVHRRRTVDRDQVILPRKTLDLLDRNVIQFVRQRQQLSKFKQATKKGLLFYGPPGTGKTHTIHYLAKALEGHTTLLISAEQVGLLSEYMTLARLLQPSLIVMEDVDLIARERTRMNGPCEELLLNKLLNEMDGLTPDADILFVLTTNYPESLERALASRPGRVDQAIEFPLPDAEGREKLVRLYSPGVALSDAVLQRLVERTEKVSAAFIKELMRRTVQFHLERNGTEAIQIVDVDNALDEMLFSGGSLNLKLLGAEGREGERDSCGTN